MWSHVNLGTTDLLAFSCYCFIPVTVFCNIPHCSPFLTVSTFPDRLLLFLTLTVLSIFKLEQLEHSWALFKKKTIQYSGITPNIRRKRISRLIGNFLWKKFQKLKLSVDDPGSKHFFQIQNTFFLNSNITKISLSKATLTLSLNISK